MLPVFQPTSFIACGDRHASEDTHKYAVHAWRLILVSDELKGFFSKKNSRDITFDLKISQ